MVPFPNGRREGANPSSRVNVPPDLEFLNHFFADQSVYFKLGLQTPSLRTCIPGDRSHLYRKDRWRLHFTFWAIQVERETVMTRTFIILFFLGPFHVKKSYWALGHLFLFGSFWAFGPSL